MKSLIHFTLLFTFCTHYFVSTSGQAVVDGNGNVVELGSSYYIFPAADPNRGGVALGSTGAQRCGETVIQQKLRREQGIPVSFHPSDAGAKSVTVSSNINIKFESKVPPCSNSTVWSARQKYVEINGKLGNPSCQTVQSWFQIKAAGSPNSYKMVHNPSGVCPGSPNVDFNVGVTVSEGGLLALTMSAPPYMVKFFKHNNIPPA